MKFRLRFQIRRLRRVHARNPCGTGISSKAAWVTHTLTHTTRTSDFRATDARPDTARTRRACEAEIGFQQVAELIHEPGADFVGTVPVEIQPPTLFGGALPKGSEHEDAAVALLRFLSSADAAGVITKAGLKPLAAR